MLRIFRIRMNVTTLLGEGAGAASKPLEVRRSDPRQSGQIQKTVK